MVPVPARRVCEDFATLGDAFIFTLRGHVLMEAHLILSQLPLLNRLLPIHEIKR